MRTREQHSKDSVKGGKASGEARRKKATMLSVLEKTLDAKDKDTGLTYRELATLGLIQGATSGNAKNYEVISNLMGEKEKKQDVDKGIVYIPAKDLSKSFVDLYRDIKERKHLEYWLEGGRASAKSSFWSEILIEELENNPTYCAIVIRKVGNTLKDSAFAQTQWGLDKLGESNPSIVDNWKCTKSPLEIKNIKTGQMIYFRGADDPGKIKSIKPPKNMHIAIIVYEEFDQMNGMAEVRKIDQSVMRGGDDFVVFRVYNTPPSSSHFVNKEKRIPKPNRLVHRSTYKDVPVDWLGQPFIDEAEYVKEVNPKIYANEYLGEETGDGSLVFTNLEIREITDEEIATFDNIHRGIDWGYFPDPFAYNTMHYDHSQRTLYIYFELEERKKGNEQLEKIMLDNGIDKNNMIVADSNEPKTIGDFRIWGWCMRGAEKGAGSVEAGFKWLQTRVKIVIDPKRCPQTTYEFSNYEYDKDKEGNIITGYPEGQEDHHMAAVRYATERIWKRRGN